MIADGAVEVGEELEEAFQDVQARLQFAEFVLEPARDDLEAEVEEVAAQVAQRQARRLPDGPAWRSATSAVRLTLKLICRPVCLNRYAITASGEASGLISTTMRTMSVDSSRTSMACGSGGR